MRTPFTIESILQSKVGHLNQHLKEEKTKGKKREKYGAVIVEFDGKVFRSMKERDWYIKLRYRQKGEEISDLRLQVRYELNPGGTHSLVYVADFVYIEKGTEIVMDVKGFRTQVYKKKKKLMEQVHGIIIKEV